MAFDATFMLKMAAGRRRSRFDRLDPVAAQEKVLFDLIREARDTDFGEDHAFRNLYTVEDFQRQVPLREWEGMWRAYWDTHYPALDNITWPGRIPYFAVTSGTTQGRTKQIPISREMVESNRNAALTVLSYHLDRRPRSRVWGGLNFMLGGSTALEEQVGGAKEGDLSGIQAAEIPWYAQRYAYPPPELALLPDWPTKLDRLVADLPGRDIRLISGTPSWLLVLADRLIQETGATGLGRLFPNLELVIHGGVNFAPYRSRFEQLLEGSNAELAEVYPASEGFIAFQDAGPDDGLRLLVDNGLFFEFIPVEELGRDSPTRHWLGTVETGRDYAIAVSSNAGVWSYLIGDTVRFVALNPPRLVITGRTKWSLSVFGEHLVAAEVEQAVANAARIAELQVTDWTMGGILPETQGALGHHRLLIELIHRPKRGQLDLFAQSFDEQLCLENEDYEAHRAQGHGLGAPIISALPPGSFARWMASKGKAGGQHKVPRLIDDTDRFARMVRELGG